MTKGESVSPTILNILVDAVIREALLEVCGYRESHSGFGWAAVEHNVWFYAYDGRVAGCNLILVQTSLTAMVRMFERVGLKKNLSKTKSMVCTLGFIWVQQVLYAYKWRATVEGTTFLERNRTSISYEDCRGEMAASSLRHHMERSHGIVLPQVRGLDVSRGDPYIYKMSFPRIMKSV